MLKRHGGMLGATPPARGWVRDGSAIAREGESLPAVLQAFGQTRWATCGTSSSQRRKRAFAKLFVCWDRKNPEGLPGGWMSREYHHAIIHAGWLDQVPEWLASLQGGVVLRVTAATLNRWMPRALHDALHHWCCPSPRRNSAANDGTRVLYHPTGAVREGTTVMPLSRMANAACACPTPIGKRRTFRPPVSELQA